MVAEVGKTVLCTESASPLREAFFLYVSFYKNDIQVFAQILEYTFAMRYDPIMRISPTHLEPPLKVLASANRLRILQFLKKTKSAPVSKIARELNLSVEGTSQHLSRLKAEGIITPRKRGQYVTYRLALKQEPPVKQILALL